MGNVKRLFPDYEFPPGVGIGDPVADRKFIRKVLDRPTPNWWARAFAIDSEEGAKRRKK